MSDSSKIKPVRKPKKAIAPVVADLIVPGVEGELLVKVVTPYTDIINQIKELKAIDASISVEDGDPDIESAIKKAEEVHKKAKNISGAINTTHKNCKAPVLEESNAWDSVRSVLLEALGEVKTSAENKRFFIQKKEEAKLDERFNLRHQELIKYNAAFDASMVRLMPEEAWESYLTGIIHNHERALKEEEERVKNEEAQKARMNSLCEEVTNAGGVVNYRGDILDCFAIIIGHTNEIFSFTENGFQSYLLSITGKIKESSEIKRQKEQEKAEAEEKQRLADAARLEEMRLANARFEQFRSLVHNKLDGYVIVDDNEFCVVHSKTQEDVFSSSFSTECGYTFGTEEDLKSIIFHVETLMEEAASKFNKKVKTLKEFFNNLFHKTGLTSHPLQRILLHDDNLIYQSKLDFDIDLWSFMSSIDPSLETRISANARSLYMRWYSSQNEFSSYIDGLEAQFKERVNNIKKKELDIQATIAGKTKAIDLILEEIESCRKKVLSLSNSDIHILVAKQLNHISESLQEKKLNLKRK